jgi:hypothetical protein
MRGLTFAALAAVFRGVRAVFVGPCEVAFAAAGRFGGIVGVDELAQVKLDTGGNE